MQLQKMQEELRALRQEDSTPYHLIPMPLPTIYEGKKRLPASYVNFLILNDHKLLLPTYQTPSLDEQAIKALQPYFDVIPIDCTTLIKQHGSLHCVTMQLHALS